MAIIDNFPGSSSISQARNFEAITPHATNELTRRYKAIWVGTAGDLAVVGDEGGAGKVLKSVAAGSLLLISPAKILVSGTTATDIVGWF